MSTLHAVLNPGWSLHLLPRLVSFGLAVALTVLVLAYPHAVAGSISDVDHGTLSLMMWGISAGFVHGVGFVPRLPFWQAVFHPLLGWGLMVLGVFTILAA